MLFWQWLTGFWSAIFGFSGPTPQGRKQAPAGEPVPEEQARPGICVKWSSDHGDQSAAMPTHLPIATRGFFAVLCSAPGGSQVAQQLTLS